MRAERGGVSRTWPDEVMYAGALRAAGLDVDGLDGLELGLAISAAYEVALDWIEVLKD